MILAASNLPSSTSHAQPFSEEVYDVPVKATCALGYSPFPYQSDWAVICFERYDATKLGGWQFRLYAPFFGPPRPGGDGGSWPLNTGPDVFYNVFTVARYDGTFKHFCDLTVQFNSGTYHNPQWISLPTTLNTETLINCGSGACSISPQPAEPMNVCTIPPLPPPPPPAPVPPTSSTCVARVSGDGTSYEIVCTMSCSGSVQFRGVTGTGFLLAGSTSGCTFTFPVPACSPTTCPPGAEYDYLCGLRVQYSVGSGWDTIPTTFDSGPLRLPERQCSSKQYAAGVSNVFSAEGNMLTIVGVALLLVPGGQAVGGFLTLRGGATLAGSAGFGAYTNLGRFCHESSDPPESG